MMDRKQFLELIQSNIDEHGYHVTIVNSSAEPRYAYTIGLTKSLGFELIFAGGIFYMKEDVFGIFDALVREISKNKRSIGSKIAVNAIGSFSLGKVDSSWSKLIMLGVFDYYKQEHIEALQILPDAEHHTFDIPDMSKTFSITSQPVWQWLAREWDYAVPRDSTAITNLKVLYGEKATEVTRWEANEWEIFSGAGPDVPSEDIRVVPLAVLIGIDKSLEPVMNLEVGKGLWRDPVELVWKNWG